MKVKTTVRYQFTPSETVIKIKKHSNQGQKIVEKWECSYVASRNINSAISLENSSKSQTPDLSYNYQFTLMYMLKIESIFSHKIL